MKVHAIAGVGALALAGAASAAFTGASVMNMGDLGTGTTSWQVFMNYDNPADAQLAINGNASVASLVFNGYANEDLSGGPMALVQNSLLATQLSDYPSGVNLPGDSWVTIGGAGVGGDNQTSFSPGFLGGGSAIESIAGTSFSQADNGGYFDSDPTSVSAGGQVLVAQFTVGGFTYSGTTSYAAAGAGATQEAFSVTTGVPAPGALALLGLAGLASRRRRG